MKFQDIGDQFVVDSHTHPMLNMYIDMLQAAQHLESYLLIYILYTKNVVSHEAAADPKKACKSSETVAVLSI